MRKLGLTTAIAWALPVFTAAFAATLAYNAFIGRFFITPVALVSPLFASVYRKRALSIAVAVAGTFVLAAALAVDATKPSGIGTAKSIWGMSRLEQQTIFDPKLQRIVTEVQHLPAGDRVALKIKPNDTSYPFFGRHLRRRVTFTAAAASASHVTWLVWHTPSGAWKLLPPGHNP